MKGRELCNSVEYNISYSVLLRPTPPTPEESVVVPKVACLASSPVITNDAAAPPETKRTSVKDVVASFMFKNATHVHLSFNLDNLLFFVSLEHAAATDAGSNVEVA